MKLTSKLLEKMIRESFEAPEPAPEEEVKSEVRVPYKDMEAEKRALRVKSLGSDAYSKLWDMEEVDPEYADELAHAMGSSEPEYPKIKFKELFPPIIKEPVLGKGKYEGHFSLSPDKTKLRVTVYVPDEDDPNMREFNGWRDFKLTKSGIERAKNWIASKMPPFPPFEDEADWWSEPDDSELSDDNLWDFPPLKEEDLNQIINEEFSQLLSERASDQEYHDFIEFLFWVFENKPLWVNAKKKTDGWNKPEAYHFWLMNWFQKGEAGEISKEAHENILFLMENPVYFEFKFQKWIDNPWIIWRKEKGVYQEFIEKYPDHNNEKTFLTEGFFIKFFSNFSLTFAYNLNIQEGVDGNTIALASDDHSIVIAAAEIFPMNPQSYTQAEPEGIMQAIIGRGGLLNKAIVHEVVHVMNGIRTDVAGWRRGNKKTRTDYFHNTEEAQARIGQILNDLFRAVKKLLDQDFQWPVKWWQNDIPQLEKLKNVVNDFDPDDSEAYGEIIKSIFSGDVEGSVDLLVEFYLDTYDISRDSDRKIKLGPIPRERKRITKRMKGIVNNLIKFIDKNKKDEAEETKLTKERINQFIEEEMKAVLDEGMYVKPGWEPEGDEYDRETQQAWRDKRAELGDDLFDELYGDLVGLEDDNLGAALGAFPESDPEAEEATFGVMSGEHSDVDWESIRRNIPFGGGRLRGDVALPELENWIVMMLKLAFKYPIDRAEIYGDSERMDLEVRNLVVRGTEDMETAAMIWDEVEDLQDYYILPILEKFRKSYKEPEDIKLMKKFEIYKKALHKISEWSAVQGDMYDEYLRSYKKNFTKDPAEPVGEKLPLREEDNMKGWSKIKELFDAADGEEDYINAMELARSYKMAFPLTGEDERFMDEIFLQAIFEAVMAGHWDVSNEIEKVWGKNRWREDPEWGGN